MFIDTYPCIDLIVRVTFRILSLMLGKILCACFFHYISTLSYDNVCTTMYNVDLRFNKYAMNK